MIFGRFSRTRSCGIWAFGGGDIALLYGGPPCQPFSVIGKKQGLRDERGPLLFELVRFAKAMHPVAVMLEQVPGVWKAEDGAVIFRLINDLKALGFSGFYHGVFDAIQFGIPQNRKRFILIAMRDGTHFSPPMPLVKDGSMTVGQAIRGLSNPTSAAQEPKFPNHIDVTPERDRERISYVPEGSWLGRQLDAPESIRRNLTPKDSTKFRRLARNLPSNTLRCGEIFYHPTVSRYLTPREYMRLHGFPDDYILRGPVRARRGTVPNLDQHRQIANSVPPPLAAGMADRIRETICR